MDDDDTPRSAELPPGFDEHDPYKGENLSTYPDWWRENISEFRDYDLRPYRPPRFADGELTPDVLNSLETELSVSIQLRVVNPHADKSNEWSVYVDGEPVTTIERTREPDGYSLYNIHSEEFRACVKRAAGDGNAK